MPIVLAPAADQRGWRGGVHKARSQTAPAEGGSPSGGPGGHAVDEQPHDPGGGEGQRHVPVGLPRPRLPHHPADLLPSRGPLTQRTCYEPDKSIASRLKICTHDDSVTLNM